MDWYRPKLRVRWKRIGLFYVIALGWSSVVGVILAVSGVALDPGSIGLAGMLAGAACMPAPMVAALIVERLEGERPLLRQTFTGFSRKVIWVALGFCGGGLLFMYGLTWTLSGEPGLAGAGEILSSPEQIAGQLTALTGVPVDPGSAPPLWLLLPLTALGALIAGFSINGLFGYFEEYGWRGWLANELRPLGLVKTNIVTGIMWGLWHTPLILIGFNYSPHNLLGPIFMVIVCIPLSFVLLRSRKLTGSLLAPGILHGIFNGFSGIFVITIAERNPLIAAPMGILGAIALALLSFCFWFFPTAEN